MNTKNFISQIAVMLFHYVPVQYFKIPKKFLLYPTKQIHYARLKHKILLVLTALTIIGEVFSIILWTVNPTISIGQARITLAVNYTIAVANASAFAVLNLVAFVWIMRRKRSGPLFLIAISIINRLISYPIFIGGAHLVFITWTVLLIVFAYLDYRELSKQQH